MKHVRLADAREQIDDLFDEVERGETLVISREGKQVKEEWPALTEEQRARTRVAIDGILELRKRNKPVTVHEIIAWKNEGRM